MTCLLNFLILNVPQDLSPTIIQSLLVRIIPSPKYNDGFQAACSYAQARTAGH